MIICKNKNTQKFFFTLIVMIIMPGILKNFYLGLVFLFHTKIILRLFLTGFVIGLLFYKKIRHYLINISTFIHELNHAIMVWIFNGKITKFIARGSNGGMVSYYGIKGDCFGETLISLAPYFIPTITICFILFMPIIPLSIYPLYLCCIGIIFAINVMDLIDNIKLNWTKRVFISVSGMPAITDIAKVGYFISSIVIFSLSLMLISIIFWIIPSQSFESIIYWSKSFVSNIVNFYAGFII